MLSKLFRKKLSHRPAWERDKFWDFEDVESHRPSERPLSINLEQAVTDERALPYDAGMGRQTAIAH